MRRFMLALAFLAASAAAPAQAGTATVDLTKSTAQEQPTLKPEPVMILGRTLSLIPVEFEKPVMDWTQAKKYIPAELLQTPPAALTDKQILDRINQMRDTLNDQYSQMLEQNIAEYMAQNPDQNIDSVRIDTMDAFQSGDGDTISPEIQKVAGQLIALQYLSEMVSNKINNIIPTPLIR